MNPKLSDGILCSPIVRSPHDCVKPYTLLLCLAQTGVVNSVVATTVTGVRFVINYIKDRRTAKNVGSAEGTVMGSMLQCTSAFRFRTSMLCRAIPTERTCDLNVNANDLSLSLRVRVEGVRRYAQAFRRQVSRNSAKPLLVVSFGRRPF